MPVGEGGALSGDGAGVQERLQVPPGVQGRVGVGHQGDHQVPLAELYRLAVTYVNEHGLGFRVEPDGLPGQGLGGAGLRHD